MKLILKKDIDKTTFKLAISILFGIAAFSLIFAYLDEKGFYDFMLITGICFFLGIMFIIISLEKQPKNFSKPKPFYTWEFKHDQK